MGAVRAWLARSAAAAAHLWRRSLQVRVVLSTVALTAVVVALLGLALAAPLAVLAYWASRGAGEGSDRPTSIVANPERLVEPAVNTSLASGAAAVVAVAVVLPVAYLSMRHRGRLGGERILWALAAQDAREVVGDDVGRAGVVVDGAAGDVGQVDDVLAAAQPIVDRHGLDVVDVEGAGQFVGDDALARRVVVRVLDAHGPVSLASASVVGDARLSRP